VQQSMGIDARDNFSVEFEYEPKHAVGRGMLRTEIDGEVSKARRMFGHPASNQTLHH
jgi:hypothetical protein